MCQGTGPKKPSDEPWGGSLPLPGTDVLVFQTRELDVSMGCGGTVLQGIARQNLTCIDLSSQCHDRGEVVGSQRWNE